jgi:hypothetical protein
LRSRRSLAAGHADLFGPYISFRATVTSWGQQAPEAQPLISPDFDWGLAPHEIAEAEAGMSAERFDVTTAIFAFEAGELDEESTIALFQHLVDTGMAWSLQGSYGRAAQSLIEQGLVTAR